MEALTSTHPRPPTLASSTWQPTIMPHPRQIHGSSMQLRPAPTPRTTDQCRTWQPRTRPPPQQPLGSSPSTPPCSSRTPPRPRPPAGSTLPPPPPHPRFHGLDLETITIQQLETSLIILIETILRILTPTCLLLVWKQQHKSL